MRAAFCGVVLQRASVLPDRWLHSGTRRYGMLSEPPPPLLRVLTVNVHKGYSALRRHFMLHELREAVRAMSTWPMRSGASTPMVATR
jgi:hypothetical protein